METAKVIQYINLKLAALGQPVFKQGNDKDLIHMANPLIGHYKEQSRLLSHYLCPVDQRIQNFLNAHLSGLGLESIPELPTNTFILDQPGLARTMSVPAVGDVFRSSEVESYRVKQGVLHNPKHDRRTTKGVFHVAEGGLPIPGDKLAVPQKVFAHLLKEAMNPPDDLMTLPFTSGQEEKAKVFVSLLMRPMVCPEVPGYMNKKSLETRFFVPGSLVSNLDFVESIFGNAGDPYLPESDAGLDIDHWTGHTGCVFLAPHLITLKKKDLGLPHIDAATQRQKRDGMYWEKGDELYNDGTAFKVTCRDHQGVMVTLIADNYFGYCKKEVKTQISYSSNLFGMTEEEHSGGAIAFSSYDLGEETHPDNTLPWNTTPFKDMVAMYKGLMHVKPEGYGIDKTYEDIVYVPEEAQFNLRKQAVRWKHRGKEISIKLLRFHTYILPSGYKIHMEKMPHGDDWHLIGTVGMGTLCHKPCTVSGGGKSEISKPLSDAMIQGPVFTANFEEDFKKITEVMSMDFGHRFKKPYHKKRSSRPILSQERSLGSVIKLLTPSEEYNDAYNQWLDELPHHIREISITIKRHYKEAWGENWRKHFSVDWIDGHPGHELKFKDKKLKAHYLRVGHEENGAWRVFKLRQDFSAAEKLQVEDDITCSIVLPSKSVQHLNKYYDNESIKLVSNCESRLFQRPDDAIHRGYDKQAEADLSSPNTFLSNYEPLTLKDSKEFVENAMEFNLYTKPVRQLIGDFAQDGVEGYFVSSAHPRLVNGKPSKNPRYLQNRPDLVNPRSKYVAEVSERLFRKVPLDMPVHFPVNAVLTGRRNNPPDRDNGIPPLAVYNPIHYQELPELFMDFICSVTGKSPSTTGFGSEGALTKGPFNALWSTADLNNALVSYILTGCDGFSSAAGYVGPKFRVDHDVSLLIPEIWCRMRIDERDPKKLIKDGYLELVEDFEYEGRKILGSRLGYRITLKFVNSFLGRIFNNPNRVFDDEMLKPETQSMEMFVEGIENIVSTQKHVGQQFLNDGSVEAACPPLKALLHIMATGEYEGKGVKHADIRDMFTRQYLLASEWYQKRLMIKQERDLTLMQKHIQYVGKMLENMRDSEQVKELKLNEKLKSMHQAIQKIESKAYLRSLEGTLGADPINVQPIPTLNASRMVVEGA